MLWLTDLSHHLPCLSCVFHLLLLLSNSANVPGKVAEEGPSAAAHVGDLNGALALGFDLDQQACYSHLWNEPGCGNISFLHSPSLTST